MTRAANAILVATVCLWSTANGTYGQNAPGAVRWRAEAEGLAPRIQTKESASDVLDATEGRHLVLQFKRMPGPAQKAKLQAKGVSLQRYLGDNAWFAHVKNGKQAKAATNEAGLHSATRVKREWKQHPRLIRGDIPEYARIPTKIAVEDESKKEHAGAEPETLALYLIFHADVDLEKVGVPTVTAHGGSVRSLIHSINGAVIWLPSTSLQALTDEDVVQWIEPPLPPMGPNNNSVVTAVEAHLVKAPPYNLNGDGISVLVYDGGTVMSSHPDFLGRAFSRDNTGASDHPTHVAGTIGGSGAAGGGTYAGVAPGVTIQSFGFEYDGTGQFLYTNPGDLEVDYSKAMNTYGVVLANNSIGTNVAPNGFPCDWEGNYGVTDMLIDAIVRGSLGAPMRIIWANGNERGSGRCGIAYNTTAPPACAKNHITVGAINSNDNSMTSFSSWGPTDDGRIKPDICAPGCQSGGDNGVTSTVTGGWYGTMCGTSMAAPAATGAAALLLQDWKAQFPDQPLPPNSLLKVLLTHKALDLGNVGPDYKFGFGALQILQTIQFMQTGSFAQSQIEHGQELRYFIPVSTSGQTLKVTVAWDDPPGAINTTPELVNDLDIHLLSPSGTIHYPWTLDPANPSAAAVRNQPDRRNNIEQAMVNAAEAGTWTIVIQGYSIPSGPQAFSLAATPELRSCSSAGFVMLKSRKHSCEAELAVSVKDCDLDTDPLSIQTVTITMSSSSEPAGESVVLTETSPFSATFEGYLPSSTTDAPGVLQVSHGDTITATYVDADDGHGGSQVAVTDSADIDCEPAQVGNLSITAVTASSATVYLTTNEPARVQLRYGTSCSGTMQVTTNQQYLTEHTVKLTDLTKDTEYRFIVEADDEAGNRTTLDDGGACYQFRTLDRRDYYTELFSPNGFDLHETLITLTPSEDIHGYSACREPIVVLPAKTDGATVVPVTDDWYHEIVLTDGRSFPFYGVNYSSFFVGSNGYITFTSGDTDFTESLVDHFQRRRISVLFDDFNPPQGSVTWLQLADRGVVTWRGVPEYGTTNSNSFQVILHFDGTIEMAWLEIAAVDGLVGISEGLGLLPDFQETDISQSPTCVGLPGKAYDPDPSDFTADASVVHTLSWQPGRRATSSEVYFGPSPAELELKATQSENTFVLPVLANDRTYFWRVDGVNASGRTTGDLWNFHTRNLKPDFDSDGDVDMIDFARLQLCFSGPDVPQEDPECQAAKLDNDSDVDQEDAALFQGCLSGPGQTALGSCLP